MFVKIKFPEQGGGGGGGEEWCLFSSIKNSFKTHFEFMGNKFVMCLINGPKSETLLNFKSYK
jgi:hypothetical protein